MNLLRYIASLLESSGEGISFCTLPRGLVRRSPSPMPCLGGWAQACEHGPFTAQQHQSYHPKWSAISIALIVDPVKAVPGSCLRAQKAMRLWTSREASTAGRKLLFWGKGYCK